MSCCSHSPQPDPPEESGSSCCGGKKGDFDYVLYGSLFAVVLAYGGHLFFRKSLPEELGSFSAGIYSLMNQMWWGIALGVFAVGVLSKVPREWVVSILGRPGSLSGICRAMGAGLLLDLCNHGVLLVAMKLYERGASYGQVLAFIIASPWNSLSMTLILVALVGVKWAVTFILLSAVIAVVTGLIVESMVKSGRLAPNPHQVELAEGFRLWPAVRQQWGEISWSPAVMLGIGKSGMLESRMIVRWILFGTVLAAAIRAFVPMSFFGEWFGPTWVGVLLTLVVATVIEVCSEGSSPIAADLVTRAAAPGNGFAFLMAGAATDYTEVMSLKETTKSWKMAMILPLLTVPQVAVIAVVLNNLAG